jgi:predicted flap endonuclease-1-like 5' DNA nuclease
MRAGSALHQDPFQIVLDLGGSSVKSGKSKTAVADKKTAAPAAKRAGKGASKSSSTMKTLAGETVALSKAQAKMARKKGAVVREVRVVHVETFIEVPKIVEKIVKVPVQKIVEKIVKVKVPVDRIVEKIVKVPVDRVVEKIVKVNVPVQKIVEKIVKVPVDRIVEKIVKVPVDRVVEKIVKVNVPVQKIVEKIVKVPVDRIVEKIVKVPVEKIVTKTVEKRVEVESPALKKRFEQAQAQASRVPALEKRIKELEEAAKRPSFDAGAAMAAFGGKVKLDDLKIVEGIGPKIEALFHAAGIRTWRALSTTAPSRLKQILDAGGSQFQMHDPGTWPRQAGLAADGKFAELKKLTDELVAGRS